jgi:hypothetical protein
MESAGYWYYMTQRPPAPGAQPKRGLIRSFEYEGRLYVEAIGRSAWGSVVYDRELTDDEISDYELVPMPEKPWENGGYRK